MPEDIVRIEGGYFGIHREGFSPQNLIRWMPFHYHDTVSIKKYARTMLAKRN